MDADPTPDELLAELRELASLDLESVTLQDPGHEHRPVLDDVDAVERQADTVVVVTLTHGDRRVVGSSRSGDTGGSVDRAAAEAVLAALDELVPAGRVEWHIDRAELLDPPTPQRPTVAHVAVAIRTAQGADVLVGSAIVRGATHEAAARAVLDAVNRPIVPLIGP